MSERRKTIWAFRRTHLLNGRTGLITVPLEVARLAIERKHASATFGHVLDKPDAPFADEGMENPPTAIPAAPIPGVELGTPDVRPEAPPVPAKRKPGRPRKNPAP